MKPIAVFVALLIARVAVAAPRSPADQIKYVVGFVCENSLVANVNDDMFTTGATVFVSGSPAKVHDGLTVGLANLHAPAKVEVELAADKQSAWFQTTCRGQATYAHSAADCARTSAKHCDASAIAFHAMGHIVHDDTWKIDLLALTATDSNEVMRARGDDPRAPTYAMPTAVAQTGAPELAKAVVGWFAAGDLTKAAAGAPVLAAGSAPEEIAMGAGALKLVASWTALHLALVSVDASLAGDRGVVRAVVRFETKKKTVIQLGVTVIAVKDGETWKWRLVDFVT
jgi:hypothetical protein